jgi:hypothetical protein
MDGIETPPIDGPEIAPVESNTAQNLFGSDPEPAHIAEVTPVVEPTNSIVEPVVPAVVAPVVVPVMPVAETPGVAPVVAPVAEAPPALTEQQLELARRMLQPVAPAVAAPAPKPRTLQDPDVRKELGIYDVSEADYDAIFSTPDKASSIKALNEFGQKIATQAVTMAHVLVQDALARVDSTIRPYTQFADTQHEQMLRYEFFTAHPTLQGQDQIIQLVQQQMAADNWKAKNPTKAQTFDEVARRTNALIIQMSGNGQPVIAQPAPVGAPVGQTVAPSTKPPMATLNRGGGGGGGGQSVTPSGGSSTAKNLFG